MSYFPEPASGYPPSEAQRRQVREAEDPSPSTAAAFLHSAARTKSPPSSLDRPNRPNHITLPEPDHQPQPESSEKPQRKPSTARDAQYPPPQDNESRVRLAKGVTDEAPKIDDDLPGDIYIPASEQHGLPRKNRTVFKKQAQAIINARRMAATGPPGYGRSASQLSVSSPEEETPPALPPQTEPPAGPPLPNGVLSSLMSHQQQQRHEDERRRESQHDAEPSAERQRRSFKTYLSHGFSRAKAKFDDPRRDLRGAGGGAGVFGALSAAAIDLAGPAAPDHTALRPDTERSGYHLSRWSVEGSPTGERSRSGSPAPKHSSPTSEDLNKVVEKLEKHKADDSGNISPRSESNWDLSDSFNRFTPTGFWSGRQSPKVAKRKKQELWITRHIASILERQEFILQLARACMLFGAPTHALEEHIEDTARVLDMPCQAVLVLSFMILSFQDETSQTSAIRVVKQSTSLDLGKLRALSYLHNKVLHDEISVSEASDEISELMLSKPRYGVFTSAALGGLCSICISQPAFSASFLDLTVIFPLGAFIILAQTMTARYFKRFNAILEVLLTGIVSFAASGLSSSGWFCYASVLSGSIVLLLPGWLVCQSALELQNRSITSGSIRLVWTLIYSLFLGFGISLGATIWIFAFENRPPLQPTDTTCSQAHSFHGDSWYSKTISPWLAFLFVPLYPIFLGSKNQAKPETKEFIGSVIVSVAGWVVNNFSGKHFQKRSDLTSVFGAATVGVMSSAWTKLFGGPSYIVALPAIMFQLPSGLSNGGLLAFATEDSTEDVSRAFSNIFSVAEQLLIVALGLVVGLFASTAVFSLLWGLLWKKQHIKAKDLVAF